jgi:hypothetical protein
MTDQSATKSTLVPLVGRGPFLIEGVEGNPHLAPASAAGKPIQLVLPLTDGRWLGIPMEWETLKALYEHLAQFFESKKH